MNAEDLDDLPEAARGQPLLRVEREGTRFTLLGTAHVSKASVDAVEALVDSGRFDAVAIELDPMRHRALTQGDGLHQLDLFRIIREGKTGMVAANLALAAYQRRLAEQLDVQPGAELKAAAVRAESNGLAVHLIDRDVGTTLRRAWAGLGFWGRSKLMAGLAASLIDDEKVDESEIEKLKQGDMLESSFGEFAAGSPPVYRALIAERDQYMAARLRRCIEAGHKHVLAVVGAGHLKGLAAELAGAQCDAESTLAELDTLPRGSKVPWFTLFLAVFLLGGFAWGFSQGAEIGGGMVLAWVLATGIPGAIGCAVAGGHPLSILGAFLSSPFTPLHPALASGTVSAAIETWMRKPTYADFLNLRDDTTSLRGWWRNRVSRVLVNFFLTSLGTAIGVWTGGVHIVRQLMA